MAPRRNRTFTPWLELLEGRSQPTVGLISIDPSGYLHVQCSAGNDYVIVAQQGDRVNVQDGVYLNAVGYSFSTARVRGVIFSGNAGNDVLDCRSYSGLVVAYGGDGNDSLIGGGANDWLYGGDGSDTLQGGFGDDVLDGGAGNDFLYGDAGNDTLFGSFGDDALLGGDGNDCIVGGDGNDDINGGNGDDILHGGAGNDILAGLSGTDFAYGEAGDDYLTGGDANDYLEGGDGFDRCFGGAGDDAVFGTGGSDLLYGGEGNDYLDGGFGDDEIYGEDGNDTILGNYGDDQANGGGGNDDMNGGEGNDTLYGGPGNDGLCGGAGADVLYGNTGNDYLDGGEGNDYMAGGPGINTYADSIGIDSIETSYQAGLVGGGLSETTNPVGVNDSAWQLKHYQNIQTAKQGNFDVAFLGDSITDHWRDTGLGIWNQYFAPLKAVNFGIVGDGTQQLLYRLQTGEIGPFPPKVAVLMIGTNNLAASGPLKTVAGIYANVDLLRQRWPATKVLVVSVLPRGNGSASDPIRGDINYVNSQLAELDDGSNVRFLNISGQYVNPDGTIRTDLLPDLLHPNASGYGVWAQTMYPLLLGMMNG